MTAVIADDSEFFCIILQDLLQKYHITCLGVGHTGYDAINLCKELQPDILLLDISMPDMDGLHALQSITLNNQKTKVIICTEATNFQFYIEAIQKGARGYIFKSSLQTDLEEVIHRVCS